MTVPFIRLDGVRPSSKKRAKEIKEKLAGFGLEINLSRSYEILAALCGYRNWATMSASEVAEEGSFLIGFQQPRSGYYGDVLEGPLTRIELPYSVARNHIELYGNGYITYSLLALAQSAMEKGAPVILFAPHVSAAHMLGIAVEAGRKRDFVTRSVGEYGGSPYEPLKTRSPKEIGALIDLIALELEGSLYEAHLWKERMTRLTELAAIIAGPEPTVRDFLGALRLENLIRYFNGISLSGLREKVGEYLVSLPYFDPGSMDQIRTVYDQHNFVVMKMSGFLYDLQDKRISIDRGSNPSATDENSLFDVAFGGGVVHVAYQFDLLTVLIADLCSRLGNFDSKSVPPVILIDQALSVRPAILNEVLRRCREAGIVCVTASEARLPPLSNLKNATTIEVNGPSGKFVTPTHTVYGEEPGRLNVRPVAQVGGSGSHRLQPLEKTFRKYL